MGARQTGGMRTDEYGFLDLGQGGVRQAGFALADVDGTIGQAGQHGQTVEKAWACS